jgi:hypothetical protein
MKRLLLGTALALAHIAPAAAFNLGCWNTTSISENPSPEGTYLNSSASVDYIEPSNEGVTLLLQSLPDYSSQSYIICMAGWSNSWDGDQVWQVSSAIICPSSAFTGDVCPE